MAISPNRIAGLAYVRVDGVQYALRGNLTVAIDPFIREGLAGMDGVHGYRETPNVPYITADLSDIGGLSLSALRNIRNSTVQAELANGKSYILRNAWTAAVMELNVADGQVGVRWEGMSGEELMAQAA